MADWRGAQAGLESGYVMGRQTGGRMSALGGIISKIADRLRLEREGKQELGSAQNLLGYKGLIEGDIEPAQEGGFEIPGMGRYKRAVEPPQEIVDKTGKVIGTRPKGSVFQPSDAMGFWDTETPGTAPATPVPQAVPAPTGKFNPLRATPGYAHYGDVKDAYNVLRSKGISEKEAKKRLGIQ